jgi:hypothetical protein
MRTVNRMAAQGDFVIVRVKDIPEGLAPVAPRGDYHVVAHSETGHDHVMLMDRVEVFQDPKTSEADLYEMFLNVTGPTEITHLRSYDTHEPILVPPGKYMIRRQREYMPEGFRRAQD